jgi:hypothetical protein
MYIGDGTTAGGVEIGGTTVSNSGDNRVITSDGTSTGLVAESNLSFNGTQLTITGSIISPSLTGSLQGSSSYSIQSLSSSFATNSSTASYVLNAVSASFASTASFLSGTVTSASFAQTATTASYSSQQFVNVETLTGNKTLTINDKPIQILSTGGTNRTITLPTTGTPDGFKFEIVNNDTYTSATYLTITTSDQHYISAKCKATFYYDSATTTWVADNARNMVLGGSNHSNYSSAIAIGFGNDSNYFYGIGIGNGASGNSFYGIGLGYNAFNNYTYGIGIGNGASGNSNSGIGIGYQARNAASYGIAIGHTANANNKGIGTVVIGAYTKAERQNEFVTTGTDNATNQAQSIIQKFRNKALATAAGAFQEIFTDASSGRLTIFASSIYQFRIQINAIEATGFKCKTWEIVGGIKRNASSSTTMMGGAPTYYITSEDSGTSNWDVRVTADDTNEALKIEVKHDSANNVTFSATVWATETRL